MSSSTNEFKNKKREPIPLTSPPSPLMRPSSPSHVRRCLLPGCLDLGATTWIELLLWSSGAGGLAFTSLSLQDPSQCACLHRHHASSHRRPRSHSHRIPHVVPPPGPAVARSSTEEGDLEPTSLVKGAATPPALARPHQLPPRAWTPRQGCGPFPERCEYWACWEVGRESVGGSERESEREREGRGLRERGARWRGRGKGGQGTERD